jgi:DNA repair ATPase RecN
MNTEKELNAKILEITMKIRDNYPELSQYLEEMPETIPSEKNPEMDLKNMEEYYNTLTNLIKNYSKTHEKNTTGKQDEANDQFK